jgi:Transposase and inactivated derivatives
MKFTFIEQHSAEYCVQQMCDVLQVSSSGFYAWRKRPKSQREQANEALVVEIRGLHQRSRETYGSPRIHADLRDRGFQVNRKRVARLMQLHGIQARRKQHYQVTTQRHPSRPVAPNLLAQDFSAETINEKWVADITYIDTHEGWLYLAAVLDVYSRTIVGWSMNEHLHEKLVEDALLMALGRRDIARDLIHHSDQGSQYSSAAYCALLQANGIQVSMSGVGNCYDNAMMESFFATLKTECVVERFATRWQARQTIFEYIEVWYNRLRRHSALNYLSPVQFEQRIA